VDLIKAEQSAAEIVTGMVSDAQKRLAAAPQMLG
jgi:hypothetical protein